MAAIIELMVTVSLGDTWLSSLPPEESGRLISFVICLVSIGSVFTTSGIKT